MSEQHIRLLAEKFFDYAEDRRGKRAQHCSVDKRELKEVAELLLALWDCIEWQGNDDDDFYRCPVCDDVMTKPLHFSDSACPVRRVEELTRE